MQDLFEAPTGVLGVRVQDPGSMGEGDLSLQVDKGSEEQ